MDLLVALDVALGLVVVYLSFSLAVTAINEGIAAALSSRAKWLRKGIENLLTPTGVAHLDSSQVDAFYKSPFIAYLGHGGLGQGNKPSYLPAWTIVQGMLASVSTAKAQTFENVDAIKAAIDGLPASSPIRVALDDLLSQAATDIAKFRSLVEEWFKIFDAQVMAWYRQKTQYVVLGLSLFVVGAANVDTVSIMRQLSSDPTIRAAVVEQALQLAERDKFDMLLDTGARDKAKQALDAAEKDLEDKRKLLVAAGQLQDPAKQDRAKTQPASALAAAEDLAASSAAEWRVEQLKLEEAAVDRIGRLNAAGLKLSWESADFATMGGFAWAIKIFGLLMSAFAVSLGAPFWFDTLKKIASIRSVGLNPAEREAKTQTK